MPQKDTHSLGQGVLDLYPAMEVRFNDKLPAERLAFWTQKWLDAGGRTYGSRLIALKNDPVWRAMTGQKKLNGKAKRWLVFFAYGVMRWEVEQLGLISKADELDPAAFDIENPATLTRKIDLSRYAHLKKSSDLTANP